ncbi:MAG TPA: FHA domain-containing protein [Nitrospira sp.]|nr:FHA domain-containing protein [Nitrospira sp.]
MSDPVTDHPRLLVKLCGQGTRSVELTGDGFTIGRKAGNDLPIEDHTVSGRHAKVVKVQSVYFLEDLKSTNGTWVNGKRIERHQLRDADVITIGQHRIIFQEPASPMAAVSTPSAEMEQTMIIGGREQSTPSGSLGAKILVTEGKTDRLEYHLTQSVALIGSQHGAAIKLTGWFAPKSAAQIFQRGGAYFISCAQESRRVFVNGQEISGQQQLKNGDQVEVANIAFTFYLLPCRRA